MHVTAASRQSAMTRRGSTGPAREAPPATLLVARRPAGASLPRDGSRVPFRGPDFPGRNRDILGSCRVRVKRKSDGRRLLSLLFINMLLMRGLSPRRGLYAGFHLPEDRRDRRICRGGGVPADRRRRGRRPRGAGSASGLRAAGQPGPGDDRGARGSARARGRPAPRSGADRPRAIRSREMPRRAGRAVFLLPRAAQRRGDARRRGRGPPARRVHRRGPRAGRARARRPASRSACAGRGAGDGAAPGGGAGRLRRRTAEVPCRHAAEAVRGGDRRPSAPCGRTSRCRSRRPTPPWPRSTASAS